MPSASEQYQSELRSINRVHLVFLDGLRGLAAIYVVIYHAFQRSYDPLSRPLQRLIEPFGYGRYAVCVFIVLSGYVLMLPVARTQTGYLPNGIISYFRRRTWRILPCYYVAYLISFAFVLAINVPRFILHRPNGLKEDLAFGNVMSHLLMVFNFSDKYRFSINDAFWSIATEWQIYFVFPFFLLPIWRKFGALAAVISGILLGMSPHYLLPAGHNFDGASLYFIGLFALGMAGAGIGFAPSQKRTFIHRNLPWGLLSIALAIPFVMLTAAVRPLDPWSPVLLRHYTPWTDMWFGLIIMCVIVHYAQLRQYSEGKGDVVLRLLESSWAVKVGLFSYSLYLIHIPVLEVLLEFSTHFKLSPVLNFCIMWLIGLPLSFMAAWIFHILVERKFLTRR